MSFNAAALKLMLEKGLTLGDVVEIAAANERRADPTARDRMARMRERRATRNVTRNPPPNDNVLTPTDIPTKATALEPKPKKHRLPINWEPKLFTPGTLAEQTVLRWEPGRMERELSKFKDHHTAAGTRWENWQAAWSKWVNNSDDFQRGRSGTGNHSIGKSAAAYQLATQHLDPDEPF